MGKKVTTPVPHVMKISLADPGMTAFHKAGLAGLWMTLEAFDENPTLAKDLKKLGRWNRDDTSVTLHWDDESFFSELFKASFRLSSDGLFHFPALGDPGQHPQHAVVLQEAILGTVLQHGRTRKADSSQKPQGSRTVEIDGRSIPVTYHRVEKYVHQSHAFKPDAPNGLVGWLYPGGGSRHMGLGKKTDLTNPAELALALRYLIVGAIYFEIRKRGGGVRPRYAMVIPEIESLGLYARARRVFVKHGVQRLLASGTAEAGLRVLVELEAQRVIEDLVSTACRVYSFGTVPWSSQQKTRVEIFEIRVGSERRLRAFKTAQNIFAAKLIIPENREPFWSVPQIPELIAGNVIRGRPWWSGFADFVANQERRKTVFEYEKGGLAKMIEDKSAFPPGRERVFVEACHEAWRRRMGQLSERAKKENISFKDLRKREHERLRVAFSRCKNAAAIRAAVTDFWARGGSSLPALREGWPGILELFDESRWEMARDLALLALASYRPANREEEEALGDNGNTEEGEKNG